MIEVVTRGPVETVQHLVSDAVEESEYAGYIEVCNHPGLLAAYRKLAAVDTYTGDRYIAPGTKNTLRAVFLKAPDAELRAVDIQPDLCDCDPETDEARLARCAINKLNRLHAVCIEAKPEGTALVRFDHTLGYTSVVTDAHPLETRLEQHDRGQPANAPVGALCITEALAERIIATIEDLVQRHQ